MLRAVVAPDKFKGSLGASEAALAIERGLQAAFGVRLEVERIPMADGGEGTVDAFVDAGARVVTRTVRDPLGRSVDADFALDGALAVVEMAAASGLRLLGPLERDALRASTYGTGELVRAALDAGARRLLITLGGSATSDGGAGFLRALGARFYDERGRELEDGGAALARLARIDLSDLDPRLAGTSIEAAADVDNPLCGPRGASAAYGLQKGASEDELATLDRSLRTFADVAARTVGRDARDVPGAGAAGGLGFALAAFLGAPIRRGVDIVAEVRGLSLALAGADYCFTGEGSLDEQTLGGKTVEGVVRRARDAGVSACVAFAGRVTSEAETALAERGVVAVPIVDAPRELNDAMRDATALLQRAAERAGRLLVMAPIALR